MTDDKKKLLEAKTTNELIQAALAEKDEDLRWDFVQILHSRGNREVFEAAKKLCKGQNPLEKTLGADILSQLGLYPDYPFHQESIPILFKIIETEIDINALQAATTALGWIDDEKAKKKLLELKNHSNEDVRLSVAWGLTTNENEEAISALIELSRDSDEDVRNWATFGLGALFDSDTPEIRAALFERLNEKGSEICDEIRGEALVGLARRKDERVVEPILNELKSDFVMRLAVDAAFELGDSRLCQVLLDLKEWWDLSETLLNDAIESCCGNNLNENHNS